VTSAYWAGRSPPPGAPPTATSRGTNEPIHSPKREPPRPFPATSRSQQRHGYWLNHERSSSVGGQQNYHSQSPHSRFPATSMERTGPKHEQYGESAAADHPPTHSPTSQQTHAPEAWTLTYSHHLLRDCPLLTLQRVLLRKATTGDIQSLEFITAPENTNPLRHFLQATGLSHSALIRFDGNHNTPDCTDVRDADSPELDFVAFEPETISRPTRQT